MKKTFLTLSILVLSSQQAYSVESNDKNISDFSKELSQKYDAYLQSKLKLNKVGFNLIQKAQGDNIVFEAPDYTQRETIFDLTYNPKNNLLTGKVLEKEDLSVIEPVAKKYFKNSNFKIEAFPYNDIDKDYAISNKAIADLYVKPTGIAGENLATQTRMGTPMRILEISADKKYAKVISEDDKYIAWIKRSDLIETDQKGFDKWQNSRNYIVASDIQKPYRVYSGTILNGTTQGNKISLKLPDNKMMTINKAQALNLADLSKNKDKVVLNAKNRLDLGLKRKTNYLWGGSVNENIDCSGFNQSIFRLEGIMLPRDADQQQSFTRPVAVTLDKINELKSGDLLFFSGNKNYATHTGIYIGDYKFIHSSPKGPYRGIKINSLKGGGDYDKYLQKIYFGGGRI